MENFVPATQPSIIGVGSTPDPGPAGSLIKGDWASAAGQIGFIPDALGNVVGVTYVNVKRRKATLRFVTMLLCNLGDGVGCCCRPLNVTCIYLIYIEVMPRFKYADVNVTNQQPRQQRYSLWNGFKVRCQRVYHGRRAMSMGYTHTVFSMNVSTPSPAPPPPPPHHH